MCVGGMVCGREGNMRVYKPLFTCTCVSMAANKYDSSKIIKWSTFNNVKLQCNYYSSYAHRSLNGIIR